MYFYLVFLIITNSDFPNNLKKILSKILEIFIKESQKINFFKIFITKNNFDIKDRYNQ